MPKYVHANSQAHTYVGMVNDSDDPEIDGTGATLQPGETIGCDTPIDNGNLTEIDDGAEVERWVRLAVDPDAPVVPQEPSEEASGSESAEEDETDDSGDSDDEAPDEDDDIDIALDGDEEHSDT